MVAPEGAIDDTSGGDTVQRRLKELSTRLLKPCNAAPLGNRPRRSPAFKSEGKLVGDERKESPGHHNALTGKYIKHGSMLPQSNHIVPFCCDRATVACGASWTSPESQTTQVCVCVTENVWRRCARLCKRRWPRTAHCLWDRALGIQKERTGHDAGASL